MTEKIKQRLEQIRRGEVPEGYKRVAQYIIPVEWNGVKLSDLGTWTGGGTPSKGKTEYWENGTICWISSQEVKKPTLRETTYMITERAVQESSTTLVPENSIIIVARSGVLQHSLPVAKTKIPMAINQDIKALVLNESSDVDYIVSAIINQEKPILREYTKKGTTVESLIFEAFSKYIIPYATTNERRAIASILTTQDKVIELKEKLLAEKQRQKKYLMKQLLTGKKRLAGFNGEWNYFKAKEIFKNISDKKHGEGLEVLSATQDKGIVPRSEVDIDIKYGKESLSGYKMVETGDFVISLRSFQGEIEYSNYTGIISPAYIVLRANMDISDGYYRQFFKSADYISRLNVAVYGIRDGKQISYDDFGRMKIPFPPIQEQTAIADVLSTADREIELLRQNIEQEKQKKKALMQLLLMGIVRVTV